MKKILSCLIVFGLSLHLFAQPGSVSDQYTLDSKIMKQVMHYSVYLPEGYENNDRTYPVLYLFHGAGGNHTSWVTDGEVCRIMNREISAGNAPEMIVVIPDGMSTAYVNSVDNSTRWEDYFYEEFIPHVEKQFRIMGRWNKRAIAGLSMGGYGTLYHALKHKDMFGAAYAMSAATSISMRRQAEDVSKNQKYYDEHDIVKIIKDIEYNPESTDYRARRFPSIYLDCGDDDFLILNNNEVFAAFKERNIPVEYRVHDGGHSWFYWRDALPAALEFAGNMFRR